MQFRTTNKRFARVYRGNGKAGSKIWKAPGVGPERRITAKRLRFWLLALAIWGFAISSLASRSPTSVCLASTLGAPHFRSASAVADSFRAGLGESRVLFSSKEWEAEAGLSYYGYRFYSSQQGRWLSRDPLGETADPVRTPYRLVGNNPLNAVDPEGQREMSIGPAFRSTGSSFYYGPVLRAPDNPARGLAVQNLTIGSNLDPSSPMAEQFASDFAVNLFTAPGQALVLGAIGSTIERFMPQTGLSRCPVKSGVSIGDDLSSAAGARVWRNIPGGHPALADAQAGVVKPYGTTLDAPLGIRALAHDTGYTQGSGLTSWTADQVWALSRQQRLGGVVVEAFAPEGSIWFNHAAKGAESQILIPGIVRPR